MKRKNGTAVIEAKGIYRTYNTDGLAVHALNGLDLVITSGEFTAIAGPSGSGKTTMLNIIGGIDRPCSGSITVAGKDLNAMNSRDLAELRLHKIGFIFQAYNLIPVLTAIENVEYILLLQGVAKLKGVQRLLQFCAKSGLKRR